MEFPTNLKYTKDHEWVRLEEEGAGNIAIVGITDFAQDALGELVYVEVETVGETLAQNEEFGSVEAVKTTSELYMPVSGKIIAFNQVVDGEEEDNPAVINEDPYGKGWIIKIELSDPSELDGLMDAATYQSEAAV